MKISHRQLRLFLRILFSLGLFLGFFVFIYELLFQHNVIYTICYIAYFIVAGLVVYVLFARKRPSNRFAYGTFLGMCFVTMLFSLGYIYESATLVSKMTRHLIEHIEEGKEMNSHTNILVKMSECCSIDEHRHTEENFQRFQQKYPKTCGTVQFLHAKACLPYIRSQRNLTIIICAFMFVMRLLTLYLLWKYLQGEYKGIFHDLKNSSGNDDTQSTATSLA